MGIIRSGRGGQGKDHEKERDDGMQRVGVERSGSPELSSVPQPTPFGGGGSQSMALIYPPAINEIQKLEGQLRWGLNIDFGNKVIPYKENSELNKRRTVAFVTNSEALTELVPTGGLDGYTSRIRSLAELNDLNRMQAGYLAYMLLKYQSYETRLWAEESLDGMKFVPKQQSPTDEPFFEFRLGHKAEGLLIEPDDSVFHQKVTLAELEQRYGLQDIVVEDHETFPNVEIQANPDRPESLLGFVIMVLAAAKHLGRVSLCYHGLDKVPTLRVYKQSVEGQGVLPRIPFLTTLTVDDFQFNESEQQLMDATELVYGLGKSIHNLLFGVGIMGPVRHEEDKMISLSPRFKRIGQATLDSVCSAKGMTFDFEGKPETTILKARKELRYASTEETSPLLDGVAEIVESSTQALNELKEFYRRYPKLLERDAFTEYRKDLGKIPSFWDEEKIRSMKETTPASNIKRTEKIIDEIKAVLGRGDDVDGPITPNSPDLKRLPPTKE